MVLSKAYDSQGRPDKPNNGYRRDVAKYWLALGNKWIGHVTRTQLKDSISITENRYQRTPRRPQRKAGV